MESEENGRGTETRVSCKVFSDRDRGGDALLQLDPKMLIEEHLLGGNIIWRKLTPFFGEGAGTATKVQKGKEESRAHLERSAGTG